MAREIVVRCEIHPDRLAEEVGLTLGSTTVLVDLCEECRAPLLKLAKLGRRATPPTFPATKTAPSDRGLVARIRNVPPMRQLGQMDGHG